MVYKYTTLDSIKHLTLHHVELLAQAGLVSPEAVAAYCKAWNAGPCRFNAAEWRDGAIRLTPRP